MSAELLLLLLALACRSPEPADTGGTTAGTDGGTTDGGTTTVPDGAVLLTDAHNYRFSGVLDGPTLPLAEYADSTISWAGLSKDLQCHDLDPVADVDNVALMVFPYLTEAEVEEGLSTDTLEQVDIAVYLSFEPGDSTEVRLSDLTFFGTEANIQTEFDVGSGAWLLVLTTGNTVGVGSRMIAFPTPTADSTATSASISDGCSVLEVDVSLTEAAPVAAPAEGPGVFDWSAVTQTGQGTPLDTLSVTDIMVARYAEHDLADLEASFLDIELLATDMWTMAHPSGTSADLAGLSHVADGSPFTGFQGDGTWLFALRCGTCPNPAPLFLAVVEPG